MKYQCAASGREPAGIFLPGWTSRLAWAYAFSASILLGCQEGSLRTEHGVARSSVSTLRSETLPPVWIDVTEIEADTLKIDVRAIRSTLRGAETAMLSCLDDSDSTGVIAFSFFLEPEGAIGSIAEARKTTYGGEAARACVARLISSLRYPSPTNGRTTVTVALDVRPRHR